MTHRDINSVVVTGATSMIGVALIEQLIENRIRVYAIVRPNSEHYHRLPKSNLINTVACDLKKLSMLPGLIEEKCDVFFHLAWQATGTQRNENIISQIDNVTYTIHAIDAARECGCRLFIGAGSQAEYGRSDSITLSPDTPVNPDTPYGIAKYAASRCSFFKCNKLDLECIWARVFSIYGIYDKPTTMISTTIRKMLSGETIELTSGEQYWDYLFTDDAGRALLMLAQSGKNGKIYCIGSSERQTIKEYVNRMRDIINPEAKINFGMVPFPEHGPINICADIRILTKDTGFKPSHTFEEGIQQTVDWIRRGND